MQRPPNQIKVTGTGRKPRAARLLAAFAPIASSILGVGTNKLPQGWQGYVTLADPEECESIIQRHRKAAFSIGGQLVEVQLVSWQERASEAQEHPAEEGEAQDGLENEETTDF